MATSLLARVPVQPSPPAAVAPPHQPSFFKPSLYVGDLHPETTEADLVEAFLSVGPIASAKLCRDRFTRRSLCYAYVNFFSFYDASWAMARLNHSELRGKPMRIMWCQRDPQTRKTGIGNLYVKNLHPSVTSASLENLFSKYGTILSCKVAEEHGVSKGFGFVQFDSEDSGLEALNALHGTLFEGKNLYVSKFIKKSERMGSLGQETFTNLFVKNLDDDLTDDQLRQMFSEHGNVCSAIIMKGDEGRSRGFGFVRFAIHEEAKKALEALNGAHIGSKTLFVGRAQKKADREETLKAAHSFTFNHQGQKSSELYVSNLDASIGDRKLKQIFGAYGKVTSAKVICDENGVSRGFGFVSFTGPEEAREAIVSVNGTNVLGLPLIVAFAQHREEQFQRTHRAQYLPGFYTPNWDASTPNCNFLHFPALDVPYFSSQQQVMYPNFERPVHALYPFGVYKQWKNFSAPVSQKRSEQGTKRELLKSGSNSYVPACKQNSRSLMDKKTYRWEIKTMNGAEASSVGSFSEKNIIAPSTGMCKRNIGKQLQSLVGSIQPEHEAKITKKLLEMGSSDAQELNGSNA